MSNFADTENLTDYYAEGVDAFEPDWTPEDEMSDEDFSEFDAALRHDDDPWGEFDPDAAFGGHDFDAEPPF